MDMNRIQPLYQVATCVQNIAVSELKSGTCLKLNCYKKVFFFLIHLFATDVLVMKKLEIEKTKPTFIISVLKVESGLSFFDFQLFH